MSGGDGKPLKFRDDSGFQRLMGHEIEVYEDRAEVVMPLGDSHLNRRNLAHGGLMATLLDSACGYACSRWFSEDASAPMLTLSLTTYFLAPGQTGPLKAVGRVINGGRKTCFAESELFDGEGTLIATASGVFKRGQ